MKEKSCEMYFAGMLLLVIFLYVIKIMENNLTLIYQDYIVITIGILMPLIYFSDSNEFKLIIKKLRKQVI